MGQGLNKQRDSLESRHGGVPLVEDPSFSDKCIKNLVFYTIHRTKPTVFVKITKELPLGFSQDYRFWQKFCPDYRFGAILSPDCGFLGLLEDLLTDVHKTMSIIDQHRTAIVFPNFPKRCYVIHFIFV